MKLPISLEDIEHFWEKYHHSVSINAYSISYVDTETSAIKIIFVFSINAFLASINIEIHSTKNLSAQMPQMCGTNCLFVTDIKFFGCSEFHPSLSRFHSEALLLYKWYFLQASTFRNSFALPVFAPKQHSSNKYSALHLLCLSA